MRVTICELPHEPSALAAAWTGLSGHTTQRATELVLLPEFAFVDPVWEAEHFDAARWAAAEAQGRAWLARLPELRAAHVVGTRPVTIAGRPFNQGFLWSAAAGLTPLRRKFFLPAEPGGWESHWFDRGDPAFPAYRAGDLSFGLRALRGLLRVVQPGGPDGRGRRRRLDHQPGWKNPGPHHARSAVRHPRP